MRGSGRFSRNAERRAARIGSQSPSLRGSGRFDAPQPGRPAGNGVSIPFIAGQWSLRDVTRAPLLRMPQSQSPSLRGSGRFASTTTWLEWRNESLNPLHCGAVVASNARRRVAEGDPNCLNPLHCGAVVASSSAQNCRKSAASLNPLHCGAVVASSLQGVRLALAWQVSIPFIAGQWSLRHRGERPGGRRLRVSIPFIAGQWSLPPELSWVRFLEVRVSIPFIAGQWSLHGDGGRPDLPCER